MLVDFYQSLIFIGFSILAPVMTFGGGILVSNALTFTGINLVTAVGVTICYFFVNGIIVIAMFRGHIIWSEVKAILPLATVGSVLGALFLSLINPIVLLLFMLFFAVRFLLQSVYKNEKAKEETKLSTGVIALLSGFLASAALPGGGLRNSFMFAKGYSVSEVYGTTQIIGIIGWAVNIVILLQKKILVPQSSYVIFLIVPILICSNFLLQKGLLKVPKSWSKTISFITIFAFTLYAVFSLLKHLA